MKNSFLSLSISKGIFFTSLMLGAILLLSSCGPRDPNSPPDGPKPQPTITADFFSSTREIIQGAAVTFRDQSIGGPESRLWEFPGGSPSASSDKNPQVTYQTPGTYEVRLTVKKGSLEDTKIESGYIKVSSRLVETVYELKIKTGNRDDAGTDANIFAQIIGTKGNSAEVYLDNVGKNDFEKGSEGVYLITVPDEIGEIEQINIRHDNTGNKAGWFLDEAWVKNARTSKVWHFPCFRWLATSSDDGKTSRVMYVNSRCD